MVSLEFGYSLELLSRRSLAKAGGRLDVGAFLKHLDHRAPGTETSPMPGSAVTVWLQTKQRKALLSAWVYFAITMLGGTLALLPNIFIAFVICKIVLLLFIPKLLLTSILALPLAAAFLVLLFIDCRRVERDDMSMIPLWLAREYFHIGPRLILAGWDRLDRARRLARIDLPFCAELLEYLHGKTTPTSGEELQRAFPAWTWNEIASQLRVIDGVILFRNTHSVSLLAPLRLELRQLLVTHSPRPDIPEEEPQSVPVDEPQRLTPHEILGIPPNATLAEIKIAYRNRVKECHPDRFPNLDEQSRQLAEEWTKALNAAYAELLAEAK
ncbi:MAG TPA: J domain-containing protein [Verrucomicrobiae bacterium]|nr:J domain-containing protein [Verrucomicrobiae bacterium]